MATSYNFTKFECEICKFPFPKVIILGEREIEMITISKPNKPYIILEALLNKADQRPDANKEERCLHLISNDSKSTIRIGRGQQSEVKISDISVSRAHAEINFRDSEFYIKDMNSKFGTLIKMQKPVHLSEKTIKMQVGRSLYELAIVPREINCDIDTEAHDL